MVKSDRPITVMESGDVGGATAMAPLGNIPDIGHGDRTISPGALGSCGDMAEMAQSSVAVTRGAIADSLGSQSAPVRLPRVSVGARGMAMEQAMSTTSCSWAAAVSMAGGVRRASIGHRSGRTVSRTWCQVLEASSDMSGLKVQRGGGGWEEG